MAAVANLHGPPPISPAPRRPLKVYAFDPTLAGLFGNVLVAMTRYEPLQPGPVGERFAVVDYDGSNKTYYAPVDLDDPNILLRGGLDPAEADPRFHQQMVYAVATETLERFERALGRRVHWRRIDKRVPKGTVNRLYLFPHAMVQANAFYSPDAHGILFGYFRTTDYADAEVLPGQTIFTCLSHDIIAHETTHAIVDGIRTYFMEPTNIDVPAFHEAFADLAALFRHFSHKEALITAIQQTGGRLYSPMLASEGAANSDHPTIQLDLQQDNPLIELARQFGQVSGMREGLRSAIGTPPKPADILTKTEPHARGSILVAAVFDAYFTIYMQKTKPLFQIFRAGGGSGNPVDLPQPLAELLTTTATQCADLFFGVCARALDYCPPVDVTFGDFLRAVLTADADLFPSDTDGVRYAIMQAFRLRGIYPEDAEYFSEGSLCLPEVSKNEMPPVSGLHFGDPNGLTTEEKNIDGPILREYAKKHAHALGLSSDLPIEVPSFHPMFRTDEDGSLKTDMVVELVQTNNVPIDSKNRGLGTFPLRSGVTLMIKRPGVHAGIRNDPTIRYIIPKYANGDRVARQRAAYAQQGVTNGGNVHINFGLLHGI
ncbi:MAG TPA: hypothetical protein VKT72_08525 [Candidatus Baltobacteraceae bacterium]|nr:hypothetical protein [Candidatus Baltobacteraceae bacterium]